MDYLVTWNHKNIGSNSPGMNAMVVYAYFRIPFDQLFVIPKNPVVYSGYLDMDTELIDYTIGASFKTVEDPSLSAIQTANILIGITQDDLKESKDMDLEFLSGQYNADFPFMILKNDRAWKSDLHVPMDNKQAMKLFAELLNYAGLPDMAAFHKKLSSDKKVHFTTLPKKENLFS